MAVEELNIQTLIRCIQEYLIEYQHEFLRKQFSIEILETIYQHESFMNLWNVYLKKFVKNLKSYSILLN